MSEALNILTPIGRMVQGDPFEARTTNMKGAPLTDKTGKPRVEYFFAIAIPKTDPGWPTLWATLQQVAQGGFPGGQYNNPDFSWKVIDGDTPKYAGHDGFSGHYVLRCSGGFPIRVYTKDGAAQVVDPDQLKRGYYIRAYISPKANMDTTYPGLYLNPSMIEIIAFGEEIQSGPDASEVFGGAPAGPLPAGASPTPPATAPVIAPPPATAPVIAPPPATAPVIAPPPATAPVIAPPPATAPVKTMTAKAAGVTYEQFTEMGWTDERLIAEGYLINTAPGIVPAPDILQG